MTPAPRDLHGYSEANSGFISFNPVWNAILMKIVMFIIDVLIDSCLISFGNSASFEKTRDWMKSAFFFSTSLWSYFSEFHCCVPM